MDSLLNKNLFKVVLKLELLLLNFILNNIQHLIKVIFIGKIWIIALGIGNW